MKIRAFTKSYGERTVLKTCEMELEPGKIYAAVGANGSGKSTFGKTLCGILRPDQELQVISEACTVSYMPQKSYAFHKSTLRNVLLGGRDAKQARRWMEALDIWHLKDQPADRRCRQHKPAPHRGIIRCPWVGHCNAAEIAASVGDCHAEPALPQGILLCADFRRHTR